MAKAIDADALKEALSEAIKDALLYIQATVDQYIDEAPAGGRGRHLMDIEKLIKQLRTESLYADKASLEIMDLCMESATALSTLHAENEKLRAELERVRHDNRKLCSAMMTIQRSESPERMTVSYEMDYSAVIDHHTARDIALIVVDGLMQADHEQRNGRELC